jgi:MFS family permease
MYMKDVLKFDIKQNGLYLMLPHIIIIIFSPVVAQLADTMRRKHILSTVAVRKISQSISNFVSAALVVSLSFVDHDSRFIAVGIFVVMTTTQGVFDRVGIFVNPQDIAPRYSGEVFGITNTAATLSGIIAPTVCGILTPNGTADEWKVVFYIAAAILAVGGIVFCVFAEGEILPWARDEGYTVAKCTTVDVADAQPAPAAAEHKDFDEFTDNVHKDEAINATNADRLAYEAKPNL